MFDLRQNLIDKYKKARIFRYSGALNEYNQRHGYGKSLFPNGDEYTGFYSYGKRHGFGIYKYSNSANYIGDFCNGSKTGLGKMIYPDGSSYDGRWKNDDRDGFGIYRYPNGDVYEGNWQQNKRNGAGKYTHLDTCMQYVGTWVDGFRGADGNLLDINIAIYLQELNKIESDRELVREHKRAYLNEWRISNGLEIERTPSETLKAFFNDMVITHPGAEGILELEARKIWWNLTEERSKTTYSRKNWNNH